MRVLAVALLLIVYTVGWAIIIAGSSTPANKTLVPVTLLI